MQINTIEVLINMILASFGGLVRRMAEMEKNPKKKPPISYYIVGSAISMFVGVVVYILCKNFGVSQFLTAGITALAGYMGSPVLDMLSDSLAWNGMHLTLLLNETTRNSAVSGADYSDRAAGILFRKNMYTTLDAIVKTNSSFASVYLYQESTNYVITSDATFTDVESFSDTDWLAAYEAAQHPTQGFWMPSRFIHLSTTSPAVVQTRTQRVLTYVYPMSSYLTPSPHRSLVIFNLYEGAISSLLNAAGAGGAPQDRTLILTRAGNVVSDAIKENIGTNIAQEPGIAQVLSYTDSDGYIIDRSDPEPMMLTYSDTDIHPDWRIVRYSPLARLYATAHRNVRKTLCF